MCRIIKKAGKEKEFLQGNSLSDMDKTNIRAEFTIWGDEFDPHVISRELNISPTEFWYKGDPIRKTGRTKLQTAWLYSTGEKETLDMNTQLKKLEKLFLPKLPILQKLKKKYRLHFNIDIILIIEDHCTPRIHFDSSILQFAGQLRAKVEIDTYIH